MKFVGFGFLFVKLEFTSRERCQKVHSPFLSNFSLGILKFKLPKICNKIGLEVLTSISRSEAYLPEVCKKILSDNTNLFTSTFSTPTT